MNLLPQNLETIRPGKPASGGLMVDLKKGLKTGVGSHTCDPNVKMLRQEDYCEFEESLGY